MYYHVIVETKERTDKNRPCRKLYNFDNGNLNKVVSDFIRPYLKKEEMRIDWNSVSGGDVRKITVKQTELPIGTVRHMKQRSTARDSRKIWSNEKVVNNNGLTKDITSRLLTDSSRSYAKGPRRP